MRMQGKKASSRGKATAKLCAPKSVRKSAAGRKVVVSRGAIAVPNSKGPRIVQGCCVFRNFQTAHQYYGFPGSHRIGTFGNSQLGVIRSYSANHRVPAARSASGIIKDEWKDKFIFSGSRRSPSKILYRLKDEQKRALFAVNLRLGRPLRFFKKVDGEEPNGHLNGVSGVWDLGLYKVCKFVSNPGSVVGTRFVQLEPA